MMMTAAPPVEEPLRLANQWDSPSSSSYRSQSSGEEADGSVSSSSSSTSSSRSDEASEGPEREGALGEDEDLESIGLPSSSEEEDDEDDKEEDEKDDMAEEEEEVAKKVGKRRDSLPFPMRLKAVTLLGDDLQKQICQHFE